MNLSIVIAQQVATQLKLLLQYTKLFKCVEDVFSSQAQWLETCVTMECNNVLPFHLFLFDMTVLLRAAGGPGGRLPPAGEGGGVVTQPCLDYGMMDDAVSSAGWSAPEGRGPGGLHGGGPCPRVD